MDERIFLEFEESGQALRVASLDSGQGITFDEPQDASPLNVGFGLQSLQPVRLEAVQRRHDWNNNQFGFDASLSDGGIVSRALEATAPGCLRGRTT